MKWLNNWINKRILAAWEDPTKAAQYSAKEKYALGVAGSTSINLVGTGLKIGHSNTELESHPDLNFRMYRATNGYVMEVRQFDKRTERHTTNLHIISDNEDLGQAISHIITVESLKAQ